MRSPQGAVLDVPQDASAATRPSGRPAINAIVDRPLSSRLPRQRRVQGPVLVPETRTGKSSGPTFAGGSGSFFRACILLLIQEQDGHGYDILERLAAFGFDSGDSGWLYRTLRTYERERVLASTWQISSSGPPRRVYSLTQGGRDLLDAWAGSLRHSKRGIDDFLTRHGRAVDTRTDRD